MSAFGGKADSITQPEAPTQAFTPKHSSVTPARDCSE
jgi:hypothetical protein